MPHDAPALSELTDEQLAVAYRRGRSEAYDEIIRRYRAEMLHFLIRFVGKRAAAEDLFQETFLQIHQSIDSFDPTKRFKPWLFTIGANKARDYLRKHKRQRMASLSAMVDQTDDTGPSFVDLMADDLPLPGTVVEDRELRQRVRAAVDQLPDHLREVILLAYFRKLAYKEIAEMLGIPLGTVKSRLHAAVASFAEVWKHNDGVPGGEGEAAGPPPRGS